MYIELPRRFSPPVVAAMSLTRDYGSLKVSRETSTESPFRPSSLSRRGTLKHLDFLNLTMDFRDYPFS